MDGWTKSNEVCGIVTLINEQLGAANEIYFTMGGHVISILNA